ncbi:MAG: hypothetical protein ACFB0B_12990 [Thermonemataceae bacterium]
MSNDKAASKIDKRIAFLIGFTVVLAITNGILVYMIMQNKKNIAEKTEVIKEKSLEVNETSAKLDSISQQLDIRIAEAKRLNRDYQELLELKEQLERDKEQLRGANDATIKEYQDKIRAYEQLLIEKDEELDKWRGIADELNQEVVKVKTEKSELIDSISSVQKEKKELEQVVAKAAILKAEAINVDAVSSRGKIRQGGDYKAKHVDKVKVSFRLAENSAAKIETKQVFMRLVEPSGAVLVGNSGGRFKTANGKDLNYTVMQQILFDNSRQQLSFNFDKGGVYRDGVHAVEVYCEGYLIGQGKFSIR